MTAFDDMVIQLIGMGFTRESAQTQVRAQFAQLAPPAIDAEKDASILEKAEQKAIADLFRAYGFTVRSLSQSRASKQAPGLADLIVMHPGRGVALWWETKRQVGGVQSPDQVEFEADCRACGWAYRLGDRFDAARYLVNLGLAEGGDGPCGIVPLSPAKS